MEKRIAMQGRSTPYDLIRDGVAMRIWVVLSCVGYMTNDEGCSGIVIVYSSCSVISVSMSTLSGARF